MIPRFESWPVRAARATFLAFDLVQDDYRNGADKWDDKARGELGWQEPHQVVQSGLQWASALGIGGMSTRGFGRIGLIGTGWPVPQNTEVQHA